MSGGPLAAFMARCGLITVLHGDGMWAPGSSCWAHEPCCTWGYTLPAGSRSCPDRVRGRCDREVGSSWCRSLAAELTGPQAEASKVGSTKEFAWACARSNVRSCCQAAAFRGLTHCERPGRVSYAHAQDTSML